MAVDVVGVRVLKLYKIIYIYIYIYIHFIFPDSIMLIILRHSPCDNITVSLNVAYLWLVQVVYAYDYGYDCRNTG